MRESQGREPGGVLKVKLISGHCRFLPTRINKERRTGKSLEACWITRQFHQLKASITMDLGTTLSIAPDSGVVYPFCCGERWPWVGDNNPSRSGSWSRNEVRRFDEPF